MKVLIILCTILIFTMPSVEANESSKLEIAKQLVLGGGVVDLEANVQSMTNMIIMRHPDAEKHKEMIRSRLLTAITSDSYVEALANVYVKNFTYDELKELNLLMQNQAMTKWLQLMPTIMPEIVSILRTNIEPVMGEIFAEIENAKN